MGKGADKNLSVIYDAQCAFCVRLAGAIKALDSSGALKFYDFHDTNILREKFPMVKAREAEEAMLVVTSDQQVAKGFFACRRLVTVTPWLWLAVPLFYFPGSSYLGVRIYSWIARNRHALGCRAPSKDQCR